MKRQIRKQVFNLSLFFAVCFLPFIPLSAQTWMQQGTNINGEADFDGSGSSVAVSSDGMTVAIGAPTNAGGGSNRGQVRVYKLVSGTWTQQGIDIDGEADDDQSGSSVALSSDGTTVAIGAPTNAGGGNGRGQVRVYKLVSGTWTQQGIDIDGEADFDGSGSSISLSSDGATVAIGAPTNAGGGNGRGQVRVYKLVSGTWTQQGIDIDGKANYDLSGFSVSLSSDGTTVVIGAPASSREGSGRGYVRVYKLVSGTWTQQGIDIDGEASFDGSGSSVAVSSDGTTVAVGAPYNDGSGTRRGQVRVYKLVSGTWTQQGADIDGEEDFDASGTFVAISSDGTTVATGAPYNDGGGNSRGQVRVYKLVSGTWTQQGIDIDGEADFNQSGRSISLSSDGATVAIGTSANAGGGSYRGNVRVYNAVLVGAALNFDGTDDYVNGTDLATLNGTNAFTFETWFTSTTGTGYRQLFSKGSAFQIAIEDLNNLIIRVGGYTSYGITTTTPLSATNTWIHLAVVYDGTQSSNATRLKVYINGVLQTLNLVGTIPTTIPTVATVFQIGANTSIGNYYWSGSIDETRIWSRALPICEILAHKDCELSGTQTGLVAYYKFNQGIANTNNAGVTSLTDASGNGNNGTLTNFALTGTTSNWVLTGGVKNGIACTPLPTPSVSIAASPSGTITAGTSVTFTASPTNGGTSPTYIWKSGSINVGTGATYTSTTLINNDVITCVMTPSAEICTSPATATSTGITMSVTGTLPGAALNFDGTDDYVNGTDLAAFNGTNAFTFETWFTSTTGTGYRQLFSKGSAFQIAIEDPSNLIIRIGGYTSFGITTTTPLSATNTWIHLAVVFDGTQSTNDTRLKVYINGVLQTLNLVGTIPTTIPTVADVFQIGANTSIGNYYWSGSIDETRIWSRALPACEILAHKDCELSGTQTGLAAYYKFNQSSGTSLTDASGNSNTGTLTNFALTGTTSNWVATGGVTTGTTCMALPTPSVSIAASPSGAITVGTSVLFTASPTNGGTSPTYVWKKNDVAISGATAAAYTTTTLTNGDIIKCVMTSNEPCATTATATSTGITMVVNTPFVGAALNFDGVNDYITTASALNLNSNTVTMSAWIKPTTTAPDYTGVVMTVAGGTDRTGILYTTGGQIGYQWNGDYWNFASGLIPTIGQWSHIAVVIEPTKATVYLNGVAAVNNVAHTVATFNSVLNIGRDASGISFTGDMDEVRIWNRALTACEIDAYDNCEMSGTPTDLVSYYKFNQSSGTVLPDAGSRNISGTLTNFALTGATSNWVVTGGVTTGTTCTALPTPSVSITASPSGTITAGTSVTFTASPTNGGTSPTYIWKSGSINVGTGATYTSTTLINNDVITCVMTPSAEICTSPATATSTGITMSVTGTLPGAALNFDGVNDYITTASALNLNSNTVTMSAWIKPTTTAPDYTGVVMTVAGDADRTGILYTTGGQIGYQWNGNYWNFASGLIPTIGQWSHIAVVIEPTKATVYLNGVAAVNNVAHTAATFNSVLNIGRDASGISFTGDMDEVRIWNRALTACEIDAYDNCEMSGSPTGLVSYYKFNQSSGTVLPDAGSRNISGTLTNFALTGATSNWVATGGVTTGITCATPSVSIAASPSGAITAGTSVTFTATPTNGGTTPTYVWKKNDVAISGATAVTYTTTTLTNGDVITCVMTSNEPCATATATSTGITTVVNPLVGAALNFDGSNDKVTFAQPQIAVTDNFTVETWFNWSGGGIAYPILALVGNNTNSGYGLFIDRDANQVGWVFSGIVGATGFTISTNTWIHVALVRSNGVVKFYVNGNLIAGSTGTQTPNTPIAAEFGTGFNGSLDETRIWSRALSQCEIQNNMNCELGSGQTGLAAYYKFNQNSGTSLTDASGNSNTGTLTNFALTGTTSNWVATGGVTTGTTCSTYIPYYTWTGVSSTNWSSTSNWSCDAVPTTTSNVTIPTTTNKPMLPDNRTIANLSLTGTNKIMLGNSTLCVNAITGGSASSYIVTDGTGGLIIKALPTNAATTFPIGTSETSYDPLSIKPTNSVDFTAKVKATTIAGDFSGSIANFAKTAKRQWDITPSATAGATVLTLTNGGTAYTIVGTPKVGHYNGTAWSELTATHDNGTWTTTTSAFSPFGVGEAGGFVSAVLPVELLSFSGYNKGAVNVLNWITANEVNNKGFQVERLNATGNVWDILGFVNAKGKGSSYDFADNTPLSMSYYRLRQLDTDGKETLSKVISVERKGNNKLKAYPNPVSDLLIIETELTSDYQILNLLGQEVLRGKTARQIDVSALPQGTYFLKVGVEQVKFVKQ